MFKGSKSGIEPWPGYIPLIQCMSTFNALVCITHHIIGGLIEKLCEIIMTACSDHTIIGQQPFELRGFHTIVCAGLRVVTISLAILIADGGDLFYSSRYIFCQGATY